MATTILHAILLLPRDAIPFPVLAKIKSLHTEINFAWVKVFEQISPFFHKFDDLKRFWSILLIFHGFCWWLFMINFKILVYNFIIVCNQNFYPIFFNIFLWSENLSIFFSFFFIVKLVLEYESYIWLVDFVSENWYKFGWIWILECIFYFYFFC